MSYELTRATRSAPHIAIFASASCQPKLKAGAFAAILTGYTNDIRPIFETIDGGAKGTTNNRMELAAAIASLSQFADGESLPILFFSACTYLTDNANTGHARWTASNWRNSDGTQVLNADLWQELFTLCAKRNVTFHHLPRRNVTFHHLPRRAGNSYLERAFSRATELQKDWSQKAALALFGDVA